MKLTDTKVKNAKPCDKQYKLTDGQGMYLLVKPNGTKIWRADYSFNNKRNTYFIGVYPTVPLKKARSRSVGMTYDILGQVGIFKMERLYIYCRN